MIRVSRVIMVDKLSSVILIMWVNQCGMKVIRVNTRCYRRCEAIQLGRLTAANTLDSKVTGTM
jgi:hypothetical protein